MVASGTPRALRIFGSSRGVGARAHALGADRWGEGEVRPTRCQRGLRSVPLVEAMPREVITVQVWGVAGRRLCTQPRKLVAAGPAASRPVRSVPIQQRPPDPYFQFATAWRVSFRLRHSKCSRSLCRGLRLSRPVVAAPCQHTVHKQCRREPSWQAASSPAASRRLAFAHRGFQGQDCERASRSTLRPIRCAPR